MASVVPSDLIEVGAISDAYGIRGWVRVVAYSRDPAALLSARTWWLKAPARPGQSGAMVSRAVEAAKRHSGDVVAQFVGLVDRNAAEALRGSTVWVSRADFPPLADGEVYWVDLIGMDVVNLAGESLGRVAGVMENAVQPVLMVKPADAEADAPAHYLIPYVGPVVASADVTQRKVVVDWQLAWRADRDDG